MFSIGLHKARCFIVTKVVSLPPVELGVVLLTQNKMLCRKKQSILYVSIIYEWLFYAI